MKKAIIITLCLAVLSACSTTRVVKPLAKGQTEVAFDAGGPIFKYAGHYIPMPLSSVSAAYGWRSDTTIYAGIHTTALAFGVGQTDVGMVKEVYPGSEFLPGVSVAPAINFSVDRWEFNYALNPSVDINFFWPVYDRADFFYFGISNWFELRQTRAHGEDQPTHWVPTLNAGYSWIPGAFRITAEAKYLAPLSNNKNITMDYFGPFDYGTLGVYLSTGYRF